MYNNVNTDGMVVIQQVANGYTVTLPPKRRSQYFGLGREMLPVVRRAGDGSDDLLEQLQGQAQPEEKEPGYEMTPIGNVFVFSEWLEVLAFLQAQLSPIVDETK